MLLHDATTMSALKNQDEQEDYSLSSGKVKHDYHDHSNDHDLEAEGFVGTRQLAKNLDPETSPLGGAKACRPEENFPVKLHYMLAELERDGLDNIVSWQPHGRCFVVHKQQQFVQNVLPYWFRQTKFPSFQRQLNLYGFKRLTSGRDKNGYYHEMFLRGKRFLAHRIHRIKIKGTGARKPSSPETEPNFYALPFLPNESYEGGAGGKAGGLPGAQAAMVGAAGMAFPFAPGLASHMGGPGAASLGAIPLMAPIGAPNASGLLPTQFLSHGFPAGAGVMHSPMLGQELLLANLQRERLKQVLMATHGLNPDMAGVTAGYPHQSNAMLNAATAAQQGISEASNAATAKGFSNLQQQQQSSSAGVPSSGTPGPYAPGPGQPWRSSDNDV